METIDGTFAGALGTSYWQAWLPESPRAVVLLVHGVSEHTGRYRHVADRLTSAGYAVYGIDHHGHGRSAGTKGNIGSLAGVVDDVHTLRGIAEQAHPDLPVFVVGHSLGGLISLSYLTSRGQDGISGVALSGAAMDPAVGTAIERAIAPVVSRLFPNLAITDLGIDNISRDPEVVRRYREDPLVYTGKVRARSGAEVLAAIPKVVDALPGVTIPALVLHGSEDRLATPAGGRLVHERLGSPDKTLKVYDGLYHEIFNEPEQETVLDDLVSWLDARR